MVCNKIPLVYKIYVCNLKFYFLSTDTNTTKYHLNWRNFNLKVPVQRPWKIYFTSDQAVYLRILIYFCCGDSILVCGKPKFSIPKKNANQSLRLYGFLTCFVLFLLLCLLWTLNEYYFCFDYKINDFWLLIC